MSKRTFKFAFGSKKISSRFGMSARTALTGKRRRLKRAGSVSARPLPYYVTGEPIGALKAVSQKARDMTPDEFRRSLVASGIVTEAGQLSLHYSPAPKKKASVK